MFSSSVFVWRRNFATPLFSDGAAVSSLQLIQNRAHWRSIAGRPPPRTWKEKFTGLTQTLRQL
jgi:hypothetical protein